MRYFIEKINMRLIFGKDMAYEDCKNEIEKYKKFVDLVHKHNGKILTRGRRIPKVYFSNKDDENAYLKEKISRATGGKKINW